MTDTRNGHRYPVSHAPNPVESTPNNKSAAEYFKKPREDSKITGALLSGSAFGTIATTDKIGPARSREIKKRSTKLAAITNKPEIAIRAAVVNDILPNEND